MFFWLVGQLEVFHATKILELSNSNFMWKCACRFAVQQIPPKKRSESLAGTLMKVPLKRNAWPNGDCLMYGDDEYIQMNPQRRIPGIGVETGGSV